MNTVEPPAFTVRSLVPGSNDTVSPVKLAPVKTNASPRATSAIVCVAMVPVGTAPSIWITPVLRASVPVLAKSSVIRGFLPLRKPPTVTSPSSRCPPAVPAVAEMVTVSKRSSEKSSVGTMSAPPSSIVRLVAGPPAEVL